MQRHKYCADASGSDNEKMHDEVDLHECAHYLLDRARPAFSISYGKSSAIALDKPSYSLTDMPTKLACMTEFCGRVACETLRLAKCQAVLQTE